MEIGDFLRDDYVRPTEMAGLSQLCLVADKATITSLISGLGIQFDLSVFPIEESMGNYVIPLNMKIEEGVLSAYVDKLLLAPFLPVLDPIIKAIPPDEDGMVELLQGIFGWINTPGSVFEVGLLLDKVVE